MMFKINKTEKRADALQPTTFSENEIFERYDIQEWIAETPDILEDGLLIIAKEYELSSGKRIDLLAIDGEANLVIIELKRDDSGSSVEMQAIQYAAQVANFTVEDIVACRAQFCQYDQIQAKEDVKEFITAESDTELAELLNQTQRIIVAAKDFRPEVAATVLWLRDNSEIDIRCVRLRPFKDEEQLYLIPATIIPLPETKDYTEKLSKKLQEAQSRFSMTVGNYNDAELHKRLAATLTRPGAVTPRIIVFLQILLLQHETMDRDNVKAELHNRNIGDSFGQAGRYLSNISQTITRRENDHLRQIIAFTSVGSRGAHKNNYAIKDKYRELVQDVVNETNNPTLHTPLS